MSDNKVIFLAFDNPELKKESVTVLACTNCGNKTWILVQNNEKDFPSNRCAVCGFVGGRFGWVHDET
jgi:predicted RNA-binding Zn-ribbon protein involved in translation (DUF1610 family)